MESRLREIGGGKSPRAMCHTSFTKMMMDLTLLPYFPTGS